MNEFLFELDLSRIGFVENPIGSGFCMSNIDHNHKIYQLSIDDDDENEDDNNSDEDDDDDKKPKPHS